MFSVVIRPSVDAQLSEILAISSRMTAAEAYTDADGQHENLNVALNFEGLTAASVEFALLQNTPNPFKEETVIGFNLPEAGEATITLQDVAGHVLKVVEGDFVKGYNQIVVKSGDLPAAGVFYYTLQAGDHTATNKMILIDAASR